MNTAVSPVSRRTAAVRVGRPAASDLRLVLERLLRRDHSRARVVDIATRPLPYASSFAIEAIDVRMSDHRTLALVCKNTSDAAMLPEARRVKPTFLRNPLREIAAYSSVLDPFNVSAPRFYGTDIDRHRERYWLFLERLNGPPLAEVGDFEVWLETSRWLARMHCHMQVLSVSAALAAAPLIRYDRAFYQRWMRRATRFVLDCCAETRARRLRLRWLASRHESVIDEILSVPATFIHGEFYASNILVETDSADVRVRPVDWELAGIGCPLVDSAALTAGWAEPRRRALATCYYEERSLQARPWLPADRFVRALDCCRLQLATQCLGWASNWTPPQRHAQDWLNEALLAGERLGL